MDPIVHVKITDIVHYWKHSNLSRFRQIKDRYKCCRALLPDLFDASNCIRSTAYSYFEEDGGLADNILRMVVNGNRKSLSGSVQYLGCAGFVQDLIDILNHDTPFQIKKAESDDKSEVKTVTPRQNLFDKLQALVVTSSPALRADAPLFRQIQLEPDTPNGRGSDAYRQLRKAVQKLLLKDNTQSLTYAIMIYVLAAWLQWRVEELPWLWDWDQVSAYLSQNAPRIAPQGPSEHVAFEDPSYMHKYHAYLFRSTRPQLFEEGYLTIEPEPLFGSQITLELRYQSGDDPNHFLHRRFRGIPMLSAKDSTVYAAMKEDNGALAHLYFPYKRFNANMYFRMALLVTNDPDKSVPLPQRLILTHRALAEWEKPYVEGLLAENGDFMIFTPAMMESFLQKFRDANLYPWMPFFQAEVLPLVQEAICVKQIFNCKLIRAHFEGTLTELQILQITLALKSIPVPGFERQGRFLPYSDNPHIHLLFRDFQAD